MTQTVTVTLRMDPNNLATLVEILEKAEGRCKALAKLYHVTEAERTVLIGEAAVCQYAYLQIQGIVGTVGADPAAPDWSAAEASGRLPSVTLEEAGIVPASGAQTDVQPTPAPSAVAMPFQGIGALALAEKFHYDNHSRNFPITDCDIRLCRAAVRTFEKANRPA
jgi:hypothetical protein